MRVLILVTVTWLLPSCKWFVQRPTFDGESAMRYLVRQCEFGPRNPGSRGHAECLNYLTGELEKYCERVTHQTFEYKDKRDTTLVFQGTNIFASINLQHKRRVALTAHWDTRPWADHDPDSSRRREPILGANDGASGVAILLEIARLLHDIPPPIGVDIILFDLEDYGESRFELFPDSLNPYCIGSEYFAKHNSTYFPEWAVNIDLVGDAQLDLPIEHYSYQNHKEIVNKVWNAAKDLKKPAFRVAIEEAIFDDHIPLQRIGIPAINIIDFNYPDDSHRYWHTLQDTPDKCSPESLKQVGDVLIEVIFNE